MNAVYLLLPRLLQAKRWGKETLAGGGLNNHQFNDYVKDGPLTQFFEAPDTVWTPRVLKDGADSVGALGALNRVYHQHRDVQRRVAAALQRARRRQARHADCDRRRAEEFGVLQGHRSADARHRPVSSSRPPAPHHLKDAPGGEQLSLEGRAAARRAARWRSRRTARAAIRARRAAAGAGPRPGRLRRQGLSRMLEQVLGLDRDAGVQGRRCGRSSWRRISWTTTTCPTEFRVPVTLLQTNACSPLATNAHRRQHLGQLLVAVVQGPAVGRRDHLVSPVHRRAADLHDAGRRPRLHASAVARQPVVDRAVPAEQHRRARSSRARRSRRGCESFQDRSNRCCGPRSARRTACSATRFPARSIARREPTYLRVAGGYLPDFLQQAADAIRSLPKVFGGERHRDRSHSDRHADRPARERQPALRRVAIRHERLQYQRQGRRLAGEGRQGHGGAAEERDRRAGAGDVQESRRPAARGEQVPRFHRESRAPVRHHAARPGQAGPHRVPEDVLRPTGSHEALNSNTSRPAPRANTGSAFLDRLSDLSTFLVHARTAVRSVRAPCVRRRAARSDREADDGADQQQAPERRIRKSPRNGRSRMRRRGSTRSSTSFDKQMRLLWKPGGFERGGNTKTHGIVRGEFIVHDGLPAELRHGIYARAAAPTAPGSASPVPAPTSRPTSTTSAS